MTTSVVLQINDAETLLSKSSQINMGIPSASLHSTSCLYQSAYLFVQVNAFLEMNNTEPRVHKKAD